MNITVGMHCDGYYDGKISPSRLSRFVVTDIIPRYLLNVNAWKEWKDALMEDIKLAESKTLTIHYPAHKFGFTNQRWDWNCDEFLVVEFLTPDEEDEDKAFLCAKTSTGEWSMISGDFTLDIESKWRESCISNWMECANENGEKMVYNENTELWDYVPLDKKES